MPVESQPVKTGKEIVIATDRGPAIVRPSGLPAAIGVAMLATILASFPGPGRAHHAFTTHYNPRETTELRGVIVDFSIQSPHSPPGGGADVPSSEQKTIVERYSVSDDGRTLTVTYVVEDAANLIEPYSDSVELCRVADDTPMYLDECDFDSASRFSR